MSEEKLNQAKQEQKEAELLADNGFFFETGKIKWYIKPLRFGTIIKANKYAVDLKINLVTEDNASLFKEFNNNTKPLMRFIAVCVLGSRWKIALFTKLLARYFEWKLKPKDALGITIAILQMYDLKNFIPTIRLIGQMTITSPNQEEAMIDG